MKILTLFCLPLLAAALPTSASAAEYPTRPITLIVPFAPGGVADITARVTAHSLEKALGQPIVIENRAGAGGNIGTTVAARAAPDGYTLLMALPSHLVQPEADRLQGRDPSYRLDQFVPIARISQEPVVLFGGPALAGKTVADILGEARAKPDEITYSSSGYYANTQLSMQILANTAGVEFRHVPYQGGGPALMAVMADQVHLSTGGPATVAGNLENQRLTPLAIMGDKRHPRLPDTPTLKETGLDASYYVWSGLFAPAATPDDVLQTLRQAVKTISTDTEFQAAMQKIDTPLDYQDADEFAQFLAQEEALLVQTARSIKN